MRKNWFKIIIAICAVAFVVVYYFGTQVGRYQSLNLGGTTVILDTVTGSHHFYSGDSKEFRTLKFEK